jgi:Fic family protein
MELNIDDITPNKPLSLQIAKRQRAEYIADTCQLEGVNFTVPEINTLLGGTTVGGKSLDDETLAINQINSWGKLIHDVQSNAFAFTSQYICIMQGVVAKEEALTWGAFRNTGVTIAGTEYMPPHHSEITKLVSEMIEKVSSTASIVDAAIDAFLWISKIQPFHDGNKRTGRLIMNGILLSAGYPAISIPKSKELEFNEKMLNWYESSDREPMNVFMRSCFDKRVLQILHEFATENAYVPPSSSM